MLSIDQIEAACRRAESIDLGVQVGHRLPLTLRATFYPLGFPVQIATNSPEVLDAAAQSWAGFSKLFNTVPIELRVAVTRDDSSRRPPAPTCRVQQHILSQVADRDNFAICDQTKGFCFLSLTQAAVEDADYLRFHFLETVALCQIAARYATPIHGACVELNGSGVLLCGDSGAGKSTLAYACARAGRTYITDDASYVINDRHDRLVVGNSNQARFRPSAVNFFSELAGREIMRRGEAGKPTIELSTPPFCDIIRSHISQIDYVVFLNRHRDVAYPELRPFPKELRSISCSSRC